MRPILNREFSLPEDRFVLAVPKGEWPIEQELAGGRKRQLVQVVDDEALSAMANRFRADAQRADFAGILVDYDHGSLDTDKSSEAAGWAMEAEARGDGLYVANRWSDAGEAAVKGGRYRFLSPVFAPGDLADLGGGRVRPLALSRLALTNDPNMRAFPLSNRAAGAPESGNEPNKEVPMKDQIAPVLGLAADAADSAVVEAVKALANRATAAEGRVAALEQEQLSREVEGDLSAFAEVVADREEVKKQLLANRAGTLAVLRGLKKPAAAPAAALPNRRDGKLPPSGGPETGGTEAEKRAAAIRNRAADVARKQGLPFARAWQLAEAELGA